MNNALDFSDARPTIADFQSAGITQCLVYTGNSRPDQAYLDELHAAGITTTFIQETYSTRSQEGFQAGVVDCQFAESRAKAVGHRGSIAVVVSDGSWSDTWDASEYGRGWASVATLPFFSYGATPICASFNRGAGRSLGSWEPETWGTGTLLTQVVGNSPVAGTDLNIVHDLAYLGLVAPVPRKDSEMFIAVGQIPGRDGVPALLLDARLGIAGDYSSEDIAKYTTHGEIPIYHFDAAMMVKLQKAYSAVPPALTTTATATTPIPTQITLTGSLHA